MKLAAFPPGWALGYLIRANGDDLEVGFLAIVGMEATEDDGVRAIVMSPTGELVRDRDVEHPLVCVVGPNEDRERVAAAGVAEWMAKRQQARATAPSA